MAGLSTTGWGRERNATTFVHLEGGAGANGIGSGGHQGSPALWRCRLPGAAAPPGTVMSATADFDSDPALAHTVVFETHVRRAGSRELTTSFASIPGATGCVASPGTREELFLYRDNAGVAVRPDLMAGEYLLIEEVRSPRPACPRMPTRNTARCCSSSSVQLTPRIRRSRRRLPAAYLSPRHQSRRSAAALAEGDLRQSTRRSASRPASRLRRSIISQSSR